MAAVLCGGIGKACQGCCECMGAVCMAPFKICGACCEGCGECCSNSCKVVTGCCTSSFCFYITVTCALNIPPIVVGLADLPNLGASCTGSMWLLVFWLLCVVNIAAAFYMSRAIEKDDSILPPPGGADMAHFQQTASSGMGRVKHLFCYDGWMAVYILVLVGFFVWLCLGAGVFLGMNDQEDGACDDSYSKVSIAYAFGWAFVFCGSCSLCCSLCCGVFNKPQTTNYYNNNQQQQTSTTVPPAAAAAAAAPAASATSKPGYFANPAASATSVPASSTTSKPGFFGSSTAQPTPVVNVHPSAPNEEVEVPIAAATPIYAETGYPNSKV